MTAVLDRLTANAKGVFEGIADPGDDLDYVFNFADFLHPVSDAISTYTIASENCTTHDDAKIDTETSDVTPVTITDGGVRLFIGVGTVGVKARIMCEIVTTGGRTKQQTLTLKMQER